MDGESYERYSRQILFRGIGSDGQRKLAAARVAVVGCGATGSAGLFSYSDSHGWQRNGWET